MMRNVVYETIPSRYGSLGAIPTLMDQESLITGHEIEDHPLGLEAQIKCGGALGWDCTETNGMITMGGIHSSRFAASDGYFVKPSHQRQHSRRCLHHVPQSAPYDDHEGNDEFRLGPFSAGSLFDPTLPARPV
jgi:hypothetical protein